MPQSRQSCQSGEDLDAWFGEIEAFEAFEAFEALGHFAQICSVNSLRITT